MVGGVNTQNANTMFAERHKRSFISDDNNEFMNQTDKDINLASTDQNDLQTPDKPTLVGHQNRLAMQMSGSEGGEQTLLV